VSRRGDGVAIVTVAALALAALGPAGASAATATFSKCTSTDIPVIDFQTQGLGAHFNLPKNAAKGQTGSVTAVSAAIQARHTRDTDLLFSLVSPSGQAIALAANRGGAGDGYGTSPAGCGGGLVVFDDAATTPIATPGNVGDNPLIGSFRPEQPFSTFLGSPAAGTWMLLMTDRLLNETGAITAYRLTVTLTYKKAKKKSKKK